MIYHKTVYDEPSLRLLLQECGFINIEKYDPVRFLGEIEEEYDDHSLAFSHIWIESGFKYPNV